MSFEVALRQAFTSAAREPSEGLVAIGGELSLDPEHVASEDSAGFVWDTERADESGGELVVAQGEAAVIRADGDLRFEDVKQRSRALLNGIECFGSAQPRCYGGFAFEVGKLGAFSAFGDARFVLPRWCASRSKSGTRVELVVTRRELTWPHLLFAELRERLTRVAPRSSEERAEVRLVKDGASSFLHAVSAAIHDIERHELDKVVVVREARVEGRASLSRVLGRLALEPETVRYAMSVSGAAFVGATPELLVATDGQTATSEAVAGTVPRHGAEQLEMAALQSSDKEAREHAHVVRAVRAALASVGASVAREASPRVRSLRHVHHLVTPVSARATDIHVLDLVKALHPTPAVCGVPRQQAQAWLAENEHVERGWFAAPLGWIDARGRGAFVVALRSALLDANGAHLFAGAGIVAGSNAHRELLETEAKLRSMRAALGVESAARTVSATSVVGGAP